MVDLDVSLRIPLRQTVDGTIRIGETRISLETIIAAYLRGDRPEEINEGFPIVELADIYAIIAYYLKHREAVDAYLARQDHDARRILEEIAALPGNAARMEAFIERCRQMRELNAAA